tara:strand:- start:198 stop:1100 length:903 start_codon:yes stop_codon:yes gene_type:complete
LEESRTYYLNSKKYFGSDNPYSGFSDCIAACENPINQLVDRYDLKNKEILSIGCGNAFEEFHFLDKGNKLYLSDADLPYKTMEPWLKQCTSSKNNDGVEFTVECSLVAAQRLSEQRFDVIYISSLHPDELYRGRLQYSRVRQNLKKGLLFGASWGNEDFYSEYVSSFFGLLKPGGLLIFQHYGFTVPLIINHHLGEIWQRQAQNYSVHHIETWCMEQDSGSSLNIFARLEESEACSFAKLLEQRAPLNRINGRLTEKLPDHKKNVYRAFELGRCIKKNGIFERLKAIIKVTYRSIRYSSL